MRYGDVHAVRVSGGEFDLHDVVGDALANFEESERLHRAGAVIDVAVQVVHVHAIGDVLGKFGNLSTDKVQFFPNKLRQLSAV